ncbi:MAG: zinc ribbon domain-containing protein [Anaerolineae bacterium]|nr:zinc ribbon domain-containing protein [Anaerolineae bacterium]
MSSSASDSERRIRLEADGELPELIEQEAGELLYCTQCGMVNSERARFCRRCGASLEEQEADVISLENLRQAKRKKAQFAERLGSPMTSAVLQVITLLGVAWLGLAALVTNQGSAIIPILLSWFLTEAVRSGSKKGVTVERAAVGIVTELIVALLSTVALVYEQAGVLLVLMVARFLVEAVRSD